MASLSNVQVIPTRALLTEIIALPFRALGDMLFRAAEQHPRFAAVEQINAMTDAELAAKGLSRVDAVRHAMGIYC